MKNWKSYDLRDLIELDLDRVPIDFSEKYEMVGVYSFGRGLFQKEDVQGSSTSYKNFYRLHPHHIIMSQLFGWEGALALSSEEFSGKYVSTQFPTFRLSSDKIDRSFLGWWLKRSEFWEELKGRAKGMGDRRRTLNPEALLVSKIVLPSIEEQHQIVEKIETIAANVKEAKQLRSEIKADMEALLISMAHRADLNDKEKEKQGWKKIRLEEVLTLKSDPEKVEAGKIYPHFGIYSFTRGLFKKSPLNGDLIKAKKLYRVNSNQFIYARLNAYEGAFGVVTEDFDGHYLSNEFPVFECDEEFIIPEFLLAYFQSPKIWEDLKRKVTGIGGGAGNRRIRLKENIFLSESIWLPPIEWQKKIKSIAKKLQSLQDDYSQSDAELDALLPSILDKAFKGELVPSDDISTKPVYTDHIHSESDVYIVALLLDEMLSKGRPTYETYIHKHLFAGQQHFGVSVESKFQQQTHGPWSKELTHSVISQGIDKHWFKWVKNGNYKQLVPDDEFNQLLENAKKQFEGELSKINNLVDEFINFKAVDLEIWMTILMAAKTLEDDQQIVSIPSMQKFIDNWPGKRSKRGFSDNNIEKIIHIIEKKGWIKLTT